MSLYDLALTLPPLFAEACGYRGDARYVALCWSPRTWELWWSDDGETNQANAAPFVFLCGHPLTAPALKGHLDGGDGERTKQWFLIDRDRRTLSVGDQDTVSRALYDQSGPRSRKRPPPRDPRFERQLLRSISAWLDWMAKRRRPGE